jgi:phage terminase large subunit-like protein
MVQHMRKPAPDDVSDGLDVGAFRTWKAEAQQKALELLHERQRTAWRPFYCTNRACDGHPHGEYEWEHARADQWPPPWTEDWLTLLLAGGRGSGKTRTGSELTHRVANHTPRVALIAATGPDLRDTMVEGVSGILATSPPGARPEWEPSKKKLTWPNGCIGQGFSAEEPDRLRGPQFGFAWCDEPAHWPLVAQVWDNTLLGLRVKDGAPSKIIATSTPKPIRWMKDLVNDPRTVVHRVSTYANLANLADTFKATILDRYEGTRLGRQELHGEIIDDVEGAMWTWDLLTHVADPPPMRRIVVGVDPAGSANPGSDETGIIVVGLGEDSHLYVFSDATGIYSPHVWASRANAEYDEFSADAIVAEKNYGGNMVKHTLETSGYTGARIKLVDSRRGKALRAEPIVALYERHRVHHVGRPGDLLDLEVEMTTWVPGQGASPNRVDALVHAITDLARAVMPASIADPNLLLRRTPVPHLRVVGQ